MERPAVKIDSVSVTSSTDHAIGHGADYVERALGFLADRGRKERLKRSLCRRCYYIWIERIGGAAMTNQSCGICGEDVMYSSTATDKLCLRCAVKHELCKQCGADIHLRPRRIYGK